MISGAGKDLKSLTTQMEKAWCVYDAMCEIGRQLTSKGITSITHQPNQIQQFVKSLANETLPVGEELQSAASESEMTLNEYIQFLSDPPDILLEKELVWPVEPDQMY